MTAGLQVRGSGDDLIANTLARDLSFKLGEREQHVKGQVTHARGGVERLGHGDAQFYRAERGNQ